MSLVVCCLPLVSTLLNVLVAFLIFLHSKDNVVAQNVVVEGEYVIPVQQEPLAIRSIPAQQEATVSALGFSSPAPQLYTPPSPADSDYHDPQLQWMPEFNFLAYVRRDVASFYREEAGHTDRKEQVPAFQGQAGKFINMSPDPLDLYWESGNGIPGNLIGHMQPFESTGTASFPGHRFYLAPPGQPSTVVCRFFVRAGTSVYFYNPFSHHDDDDGACRHSNNNKYRSVATLSEHDQIRYDAQVLNYEFGKAYKEFTGGSEWLSMYPRSPPLHPIWPTDYIGQQHKVYSRETQFHSNVPASSSSRRILSWSELENHEDIAHPRQRHPGEMEINLTVLSCEPRLLEIQHFLSDVEVDHILELAKGRNLHLSTTGKDDKDGKADVDTRTSYNTWISRYSSPIVEAIYRRVADVLHIDESLLRHRSQNVTDRRGASSQPLSEDLQLVHYEDGQQYTAHHDFSYPDRSGDGQWSPPSRSINVLMYLNEGMEGGETSFPRWRNGETTRGLNVVPQKGKAVIFYMVTPDGNLDDLTQHAALPVTQGEKWLANLWIWDPVRW